LIASILFFAVFAILFGSSCRFAAPLPDTLPQAERVHAASVVGTREAGARVQSVVFNAPRMVQVPSWRSGV
jgi:hypothetical protein